MRQIVHGGNREKIAKDLGKDESELIDFSANINPLGISDVVLQAIKDATSKIVDYPNPNYPNLKQAIAKQFNVRMDDVFVGNGAVQLIFDVTSSLNLQNALVLSPTFGEYERAFNRLNMKVDHFVLSQDDDFKVDVDRLILKLKENSAIDLVCICNPNNPTGQVVPNNQMVKLANFCSKHNIWLVIDEAFMDLTTESDESFLRSLTEPLPVIVLRSATKFFAIPGLRLGFAITKNAEMKARMIEQQEPWSVNTFADAVGTVMYTDKDYINKTQKWFRKENDYLGAELRKIPQIHVFPSSTNYFLIKANSNQLREKLWGENIMIRSCKDYLGLDDSYFRIAVKSHQNNVSLIEKLKKVIAD